MPNNSTRQFDIIPTCLTTLIASSTPSGSWILSSRLESWLRQLWRSEYHDEPWIPSSLLEFSSLNVLRRCCAHLNFHSFYSHFWSVAMSLIACELDSPSIELESWSPHRLPTAMSWDSMDAQRSDAWLVASLWLMHSYSLWTKFSRIFRQYARPRKLFVVEFTQNSLFFFAIEFCWFLFFTQFWASPSDVYRRRV